MPGGGQVKYEASRSGDKVTEDVTLGRRSVMALVVLGLIKSSRTGVVEVEPSDSRIDGSAGNCVIVLFRLEFLL